MRKVAVVLLFGAILLVITTPLGLYFLGLSNVEGRPTPPLLTSNVVADSIELQGVLRTKTHIVVHPSNPWIYAAEAIDYQGTVFPSNSGTNAAWLVARDYNINHLRNHRMSWWAPFRSSPHNLDYKKLDVRSDCHCRRRLRETSPPALSYSNLGTSFLGR